MNCRPHFFVLPLAAVAASLAVPPLVAAQAQVTAGATAASSGSELPPYLQCVPYAREVSGIDIYGDALTWWDQAEGRFERGHTPREGAVMAFIPTGNMQLGHVAAVAKVIDSRTVLLDHANWSPINGRRGQIERNVKAVDVSPNNDWSQVRVWYYPLQALGTTPWPVQGFIYPDGKAKPRTQQRFAQAAPAPVRPQPTREEPSRAFLAAFADAPPARAPQARTSQPRVTQAAYRPAPAASQASYATARPLTPRRVQASAGRSGGDAVVERAVALYD
ncbi:CHAP domain-containing protein [Alteriqipengyuania abyssalis]|uniref:CHAP domain-containing protein n=1 Tax=Alteriqipengyuania abyssalis TaxID=2860200 RepID=UPI002007040D|nr:CHAP domain-containing protein [Alteriqipengyuania abyssalis]